MSFIGPLKPLLTTLVLPPAGPLLLVFGGLWMVRRRHRSAWTVVGLGALALWLCCTPFCAVLLRQTLLTHYPPVTPAHLKDSQAIVVLGGGVDWDAPEYGMPILSPTAHERLLYGAHLARQSKLPLIFSGGKGWAAPSELLVDEAAVAATVLQREFNRGFDGVDDASRDTRENAQRSYERLSKQGITRILLVTNDWHMQRSVRNFEQAGFVVQPAPMGYLQSTLAWHQKYLPTEQGLNATRKVLREYLGLLFT